MHPVNNLRGLLRIQRTCGVMAAVCCVVSVIGLISFLSGMRSVNIGAFVFPLVLSVILAFLYRRRKKHR